MLSFCGIGVLVTVMHEDPASVAARWRLEGGLLADIHPICMHGNSWQEISSREFITVVLQALSVFRFSQEQFQLKALWSSMGKVPQLL